MAKKKPTKSKRKSPKKKGVKRSIFKQIVKWLFVLGLWGGIFMIGLVAWYAGELPDITKQATFERKTSITVKASDGSVITRYGELHGNSLSIEDIPDHLIYAVIAIEDRRFYSHFGIDPLGFARAMMVNIRERRFAQGGSTITQQLAKNLFLSRDRKIKRKIQEAMLALWLERELSKDEIMSAYLNRVYLGAGAYGVDAASRLYFNKAVKDINLRQAATLAGLLKAPSRYSPLHNPTLAKERADVVLSAMVQTGYINETKAKNLTNTPPKPVNKRRDSNAARYYTDWIVDGLDDLIGTPAEDIIVETTLNPRIQKQAAGALVSSIQADAEAKAMSQGAAIIMRPNGAVVGMVGGVDYTKSQFNRAVQAKRQPGSAFKPVVYLTALESGWKPDDIILDAPIDSGSYRPKNFGNKYMGEVTLAAALKFSLNTVAFRIMKSVGVRAVKDTAKRLGIISNLPSDMSLSLGSGAVSPLDTALRTLGLLASKCAMICAAVELPMV